jgi:hypothetical protein
MTIEATPAIDTPPADAPVDVVAPATTLLTDPPADEPKIETPPADAPKADEPKADDPDAPKGEDEPKDDDKPTGAPEEYADFEVAEGVALDETTLGEFKGVAKDLNLPQDSAQKLVDLATQMSQRWADQFTNQVTETRQGWLDASKADKEFGGDKLGESLATAKRAIDAYGTPELTQLLNETGIGNHPEVIRFMARAGKGVTETGVVKPDQTAAGTPKTLAERMYPTKSTKE